MSIYTKEDILKIVEQQKVNFIFLQFTDILGMLKSVAITAGQLEKALDNRCAFDGSSIDGFVRIEESDMTLHPDLDTFIILPWQTTNGKAARLICDVYRSDGTPFEGDPRYVLKQAVKQAAELGYSCDVGPECEFFLFHLDEYGRPTTNSHDSGGYFDMGPVDRGEVCRNDICLALEQVGFEIEASHHENARAQHEIDFKYDEVLKTADNVMTFKYIVKSIANQHGLYATFMPKPVFGECGSGMHTNISLNSNGVNAFYEESDEYGLSPVAYNFIAGIMEHCKDMALVTNPLVNSYKRLVPGYEAPIHIAWSASNRSPLIRIPSSKGKGTRVEMRNPDPAANPYLEMAVTLLAGLDGIKRNLTPPPPIDSNVYAMSDEQLKQIGIHRLPRTLGEAIHKFKKSEFMAQALGKHVFEKYAEAKESEWREYRTRVSTWEIEKYLGKY